MSSVVIGRVGNDAVVDTGLCIKSGVETDDRVILRGSTTPGWVDVLLLLTIIGWLFAQGMASRSYSLEVPFRHDLYRRWVLLRRLAWALNLGGVAMMVWAASQRLEHSAWFLGITAAGLLWAWSTGCATTSASTSPATTG